MRYHLVSIFPEIFDSFLATSLIEKAISKGIISCNRVDPRMFCDDKHQQVDDEIYGGGAGLLLKAQPVIDALKTIFSDAEVVPATTKVILLAPSKTVFTQQLAHTRADRYDDIVLICGRYEGIDHRVELWCQQQFGDNFQKVSLGEFVTLGGEVPAMSVIEAVSRLLPGVIKEDASRQNESYRPEKGGENIEHPNYTRPATVEGFSVPEVLLSGDHAAIETWRSTHETGSE